MLKRVASAGLYDNGQVSKRQRSATPEDGPYATRDPDYNLDGAGDEDNLACSDGDERPDVVRAPPRSAYKIPAYTHENRTMRLYAGPLRKWDRRQALVNTVYGPRKSHIELFCELQQRWSRCTHPVAYRKLITETEVDPRGEVLVSPWLPNNLENNQKIAYITWSRNYVAAMQAAGQVPFGKIEDMSEQEAQPFLPWVVNPDANLDLISVYPTHVTLRAGVSSTQRRLKGLKLPLLFNAGGKVLSLAWAPLPRNDHKNGSLLAVAVVPHDHDDVNDSGAFDSLLGMAATKQERTKLDERLGSVQFWRVSLRDGVNGPAYTFSDGLCLDSVCCFYWGWPKQLEWCPIQPHKSEWWPGLLAIRTEDGIVRIIKPKKGGEEGPKYGRGVRAMATLDFPGEDGVHATCMSWVGINRIVVGYTDGTIVLWSLFPQLVLLRIQTHTFALQDIKTGYPSKPYMVTVRPVEGVLRLIDLTRPSSEHTFHPSPVAGIQGNMLDWVEHMQGFATAAPANSPVNNKLDFLHHRHFPCPRKFFPSRRESPATCLAVGKVHPFALVGAADGKVWACNMLDTVFPTHWESHVPYSTLLLDSEFKKLSVRWRGAHVQYSGNSARGVVNLSFTFRQELDTKADVTDDDAMDMDDVSGPGPGSGSGQGQGQGQEAPGPVIHEKASAVSALAWNPDLAFGTHFAVGLASGLVLIRNCNGKI